MSAPEWISTSEAARMLGYSRQHFTSTYCREDSLQVVIQVRLSTDGRRLIRVLKSSVQQIVRRSIRQPG